MITIPDKPLVCFDIDNTLVAPASQVAIAKGDSTVSIGGRKWAVHEAHLEMLRDFHARGHTVILWSQGGSAWAAEVAKALEIEELVAISMPKPFWVADDMPIEHWMAQKNVIYLPFFKNKGNK